MTTSIRSFVFLATFVVVTAVLNTAATAQHSDIFITNIGAAQTGIGAADVDGGMFDIDTRVFESVLVASGAPDYSRNEPGFFALSNLAPGGLFPSGASALPANADVTLSFRTFTVNGNSAELFYWDGQGGSVNFMPATGRSISLSDSQVQDRHWIDRFSPGL